MSNMKFSYIRNPEKKRDVTIVSNIFYVDEKPFIEYGYSFRSNHDVFKKKEGRKFATQRMVSRDSKYSGVISIDTITHNRIMSGILIKILENSEHIPKKFLIDIEEKLSYYDSAHYSKTMKTLLLRKIALKMNQKQ